MKQTPYSVVPTKAFLTRMIRPGILVFFVGFLLMGALSADREIQLPPFQMARYQYERLVIEARNFPPGCASPVNEVQQRKCGELQTRLLGRLFWAALPIAFVGIFLLVGRRSLRRVYRRTDWALARNERGLVVGIVTKPAELPNDLFGWAHCLRAISVAMPDGKQLKAYVPISLKGIEPGQKMNVFTLGQSYGEKRFMAAPYAPHVAVISG